MLSGYNPTTRDATKINFDEAYFNNSVAVPLERQREEAMNQAREATPLYSSRARKEINDVNTKYAQDLLGARSNMQYQTDLQNAQFAEQSSRDNMAAQNEFANNRIQYNMGLDQMKDAYMQNRMAQIQALLGQTPYQTQDTMSGIQKVAVGAGVYKALTS